MALKILSNQVGKLDWRKRSHNIELERLKLDLLDVKWTQQETADHLEISFKRLRDRVEKHIDDLQRDSLKKYPPDTPQIPPWEQQNCEHESVPMSVTQLTEFVVAVRAMLEQLKEMQHENIVLKCKPFLEDWEKTARSFEEALDNAKNRQRKRSINSLIQVEDANKEEHPTEEKMTLASLGEEWEDDFFEDEAPVPTKSSPKTVVSPTMRGFRFSSRVRAMEGLRKRTHSTDVEKENENLLGELATLTGQTKSAALRIQESLRRDRKVTDELDARTEAAVDLAHQLNRRAKELLSKATASDIGFCLALSVSMLMFWVTFVVMYFL